MEEKAAVDEVMAVAAAVAKDDDDDNVGEGMQCSEHPYRRNPGGICAFCLQEKLGKLLSAATPPTSFFTATTLANTTSSAASTASAADIPLLKRSKSVAPRPIGDFADSSPRKKKKKKKHFWSFLYHHSSSSAAAVVAAAAAAAATATEINQQHTTQDAEGGSQALSSSSGRKVGRSRSVGCGSRSFSGDFLERISTGLGDCTLRRVESHREARKHSAAAADAKIATPRNVIKERVRCGGIFRMSSTPSSSSSYWLSAAAAGDDEFGKGESGRRMSSSSTSLSNTRRRNRNWGWAFASPMRAFKPVSASKSTFGTANAAVASINRSTGGRGCGNANPPSSLLVGGG